jgi:hypothetical protein
VKDLRNTAITYRYRDGSNYKISRTVIFAGPITLGDRDRLIGSMIMPEDEDLWGVIIPGQVGLQDLQNQFHQAEIRMLEGLLAPQEGAAKASLETADQARFETLLSEMRAAKPMWREDEDHIYHDVTDIALTEQAPTDPRTIGAFIAELGQVTWDHDWRPPFHAEMVANYEASLGDPDNPSA